MKPSTPWELLAASDHSPELVDDDSTSAVPEILTAIRTSELFPVPSLGPFKGGASRSPRGRGRLRSSAVSPDLSCSSTSAAPSGASLGHRAVGHGLDGGLLRQKEFDGGRVAELGCPVQRGPAVGVRQDDAPATDEAADGCEVALYGRVADVEVSVQKESSAMTASPPTELQTFCSCGFVGCDFRRIFLQVLSESRQERSNKSNIWVDKQFKKSCLKRNNCQQLSTWWWSTIHLGILNVPNSTP
eukprot:s1733_g13.t1